MDGHMEVGSHVRRKCPARGNDIVGVVSSEMPLQEFVEVCERAMAGLGIGILCDADYARIIDVSFRDLRKLARELPAQAAAVPRRQAVVSRVDIESLARRRYPLAALRDDCMGDGG